MLHDMNFSHCFSPFDTRHFLELSSKLKRKKLKSLFSFVVCVHTKAFFFPIDMTAAAHFYTENNEEEEEVDRKLKLKPR